MLLDIKALDKKIGFILITGNAVEMPWLNDVEGVIQTWYLGSMAGHAIADVVSGDVNPSGKLPFSFPKKLEDNGAVSFGVTSYPGIHLDSNSSSSPTQHYKEDILVGYRWYDTKKVEPQYAFGYGMSYTNFKIDNTSTNGKSFTKNGTISVTCKVTNTGDADGAEVVQVYVGKPKSKVKRALKELKGFSKVVLKKGETQSVTISIPIETLAFYDESISDWNIETGAYDVYISNASNNISKKIKITVN